MSYAAKCWCENRIVLRADNFICYTPSHGQQDVVAQSEITITSIYMNSNRVENGVKFGYAQCSEFSDIDYSRSKHITGCPFSTDVRDTNEESSTAD